MNDLYQKYEIIYLIILCNKKKNSLHSKLTSLKSTIKLTKEELLKIIDFVNIQRR